jgi:hypothetical protein
MFSIVVNFHVLAKKQKKLEIFCCLFFSWLSQMFSFVANFHVLAKKPKKIGNILLLVSLIFWGKSTFFNEIFEQRLPYLDIFLIREQLVARF